MSTWPAPTMPTTTGTSATAAPPWGRLRRRAATPAAAARRAVRYRADADRQGRPPGQDLRAAVLLLGAGAAGRVDRERPSRRHRGGDPLGWPSGRPPRTGGHPRHAVAGAGPLPRGAGPQARRAPERDGVGAGSRTGRLHPDP